jgi:hypothetical protein
MSSARSRKHDAPPRRRSGRNRRERAGQAAQRADEATQRGDLAMQRAEQSERMRIECEMRVEALQRQYDMLQGSLRTFLRGYLPRLRRHLFGQRR